MGYIIVTFLWLPGHTDFTPDTASCSRTSTRSALSRVDYILGRGCSMTRPCVEELGQGQPFVEPLQLQSRRKRWSIRMNVDIGEVEYGWLKLKRRMYNGRIVGPTWNVKQGDIVEMTLNNKLSNKNNYQDKPLNAMNHPNTTNMHTHGLHISGEDPQDNVLRKVDPGKKYKYVYRFDERNPSGTYWYHAHAHQATMFHVHSGMSGMLIMNDNIFGNYKMPWQLAAASCPYNCESDIQMVFQPLLMFGGFLGFTRIQDAIGDDPYFQLDDIMTENGGCLNDWLGQNVNFITVNGQLQPELTMVAGRMYRFRMVNGAGFDTLEVFIVNKGTTRPARACEIREIALDGVYLDKPRKMNDGQTLLAPGQRTDWLVICNRRGTYELRSYPKDRQTDSMGEIDRYDGVLMTLKVERQSWLSFYLQSQRGGLMAGSRNLNFYPNEAPSQMMGFGFSIGFPRGLPRRPNFVSDLRYLRQEDIKERFVMEFNTRLQLNRQSWKGGDNFRYKMTVNEVQEWHVVNTDNVDSHPLHIHINHFQIISYNKYHGGFSLRFEQNYILYNQDDKKPCYHQREGIDEIVAEEVPDDALRFLGHEKRYWKSAGNTLAYARIGDWRDTLLIPPLSNITIRFIPDRYTGVKVIHCHLLGHEDAGMMMVTDIVKKGQSLDANIQSGNAYPGTCRRCDRYPFNNPQTLCESGRTSTSNSRRVSSARSPRTEVIPEIPELWKHKIRPRGRR